ncbi:MAG: hypothetical protein HYV47_03965 [Candidatus Nealsonbacteria bacterium]|nr:hypothetical protein [Candidatus Nealsonbacteria bacterium]
MENIEAVKNKLQKLINQYNLDGTTIIDRVEDLVWNEEGDKAFSNFIQEAFKNFEDVKDIEELNRIMQVFNDAWNYLPHKCLNGKSPAEFLRDSKK